MTPGENHNEWYQYYCSIFYAFKRQRKFASEMLSSLKVVWFTHLKTVLVNVSIEAISVDPDQTLI